MLSFSENTWFTEYKGTRNRRPWLCKPNEELFVTEKKGGRGGRGGQTVGK